MAGKVTRSVESRFWPKVSKQDDGCWIWTAYVSGNGYGYFYAGPGKSRSAHRYSYELIVGPIPVGLDLDHLCRIRACVNPAHLEPVTRSENLLRGGIVTMKRIERRTGHVVQVDGKELVFTSSLISPTVNPPSPAIQFPSWEPPAIEPGHCQCGCGQPTLLAPRNRRRDGWTKGEPIRFIHGHRLIPSRAELFRLKVSVQSEEPKCWIWTAALDSAGYGKFRSDTELMMAHRYSYELAGGVIPPGMVLDHLCRVRACVNPGHLEPVTPHENLLRGETITAAKSMQTECIHGHAYTVANTYICPNGCRDCRECRRLRGARSESKRKAARSQ